MRGLVVRFSLPEPAFFFNLQESPSFRKMLLNTKLFGEPSAGVLIINSMARLI
jgi:hypothetical protein